ncbi:MAG: hypothetical protein ABW078_07465 [Sedimenticola sp.]
MKQTVKFRISDEIVDEAHKCIKDHACLTDPDFELCGIGFCKTDKRYCILLCEKGDGHECPYKTDLGNQMVCTCPVRQEIFKKYGV